MTAPQPNGDIISSDFETFSTQREALSFVAGYVAAKCRGIDASLGTPSREAPPSSVPSSWIRAVSHGSLLVPSDSWMTVVEEFEVLFSLVMGPSVSDQTGLVRRLLGELRQKRPELDARIARKLVTTRMHLRIRWLNQVKAAEAEERRAAKQVAQHSKNSS
ncbi:uncharacterized protein LOC122393618 [Amphibalanus amphitrite]|uniref:uncharacterized protein LOC122393618 n=1 Tax=Amphibalanus amphitrite TaxID=1232801 RepID=UPI001C904DF7|nr:uncharacterized protein LOC122393618 [Amphibalanus amphitrite]